MDSEPFTTIQPAKVPLGSATAPPWICTAAKSELGVVSVMLLPVIVSTKTMPLGSWFEELNVTAPR